MYLLYPFCLIKYISTQVWIVQEKKFSKKKKDPTYLPTLFFQGVTWTTHIFLFGPYIDITYSEDLKNKCSSQNDSMLE